MDRYSSNDGLTINVLLSPIYIKGNHRITWNENRTSSYKQMFVIYRWGNLLLGSCTISYKKTVIQERSGVFVVKSDLCYLNVATSILQDYKYKHVNC
jgi:hypothetical protein